MDWHTQIREKRLISKIAKFSDKTEFDCTKKFCMIAALMLQVVCLLQRVVLQCCSELRTCKRKKVARSFSIGKSVFPSEIFISL
jgi:hypothetical protein